MNNHKNQYSLYSTWFCYLSLIVGVFLFPKFLQGGSEATISWDVFGYYLYLPGKFIYNDLAHLSFAQDIITKYHSSDVFNQFLVADNGNYVIKYPIGQAIAYAPFFFLAHAIALLTGLPADGYSSIYQIAIFTGSLTFAFLSLWTLRKILLRFFPDPVVGITLLILTLGTNYYNYVVYDGAMAHNLLFLIYVLIIYYTIKWHEKPSALSAFLIGFLLGFATITRPSEMICVLIPVLWGIKDKATFISKINLLAKHWRHLLLLVIGGLIIVSLQLIYWKSVSGHFIMYSYGEQGFSFLRPHVFNVLFSYRKGWLIYTPVMIFSILGFIFLFKKNRAIFYSLFIFFLINLWIVTSWDEWGYGGSYSCRALVQSYPIMSFALAAFIMYIFSLRNKVVSWIFSAIGILFCVYNLYGTRQAHGGIFHPSDMSRSFYWKGFLNPWATTSAYKYIDIEDEITQTDDYNYIDIASNDFNNYSDNDTINTSDHSKCVALITPDSFTPVLVYKINKANNQNDWVKASADVYYDEMEYGDYSTPRLIISFDRDGKSYKWEGLRFQKIMNVTGKWHEISFESRIPKEALEGDEVKITVWNISGKKLFIDNLKMQIASIKK